MPDLQNDKLNQPREINLLQNIEKIAEKAIRDEYIDFDGLSLILAADEEYGEHLGRLWKDFQLDKRNNSMPEIQSERNRIVVWQKLLHRFVFGVLEGVKFESGTGPRYIRIHRFDSDIGDWEPSTAKGYFEDERHGPIFISLKEIESYFTKILKLPLPYILFADRQIEKQLSGIEKKDLPPNHIASLNQIARDRCREMAIAILKKKPDAKIIDVIFDDQITRAATKPDNSMYTDKTIRNWIKDLFPPEARKPGRRPKKQ